jgi:hypothetical protein
MDVKQFQKAIVKLYLIMWNLGNKQKDEQR